MAEGQTKRALPAKVAAMKARKRRRLENNDESPVAKKTSIKQNANGNIRQEELSWSEVAMPDRLEDLEGFYGLEEIEDVDVVRDEKTGSFAFRKIGQRPDEDEEHDGNDPATTDHDDEEWDGFDDDAPNNVPGILKTSASDLADKATAKKKTKAEKKKAEKQKADKKKSKPVLNSNSAASTDLFAGLQAETADETADVSLWQPLELSPDTLASLARLKFSKPTPIQSAAIPEILAGHDVIGKASTGSGKTMAFGIPIFETFLELRSQRQSGPDDVEPKRAPLALILSPTRELAHQLDAHFTALCSGLPSKPPSIATLTGGLSLQKQQRLLKTADIVIGTPGRLWEVISEGHGIMKWLKQIRYLVVDEADRLLSQGHFKEVEEILNALDRKDNPEDGDPDDGPVTDAPSDESQRQTLVFSATFHKGLQQKLAGKGLPGGSGAAGKADDMEYLLKKLNFRDEKPKYIDVNPKGQMATGLKEGLVECGGTEKDLYLYSLLLLHPGARALVFTNSISAVRRLTPFLQNLRLPVLPLHSQMPQKARLRSIERFSAPSNTGSILVSTDVAARGLDIPNVQLVVHYHLPRAADTYVHRSGRTARAGETGSSILICGPEEVVGVRRLVAKVHVNSAAATAKSGGEAARSGYFIRSLDIDRRVVARLKPRASLAKQLADVTTAKEKKSSEDDFMRKAAEELGVDYDSEEFDKEATGKRGRGAGRQKKEREARGLSRDDVQSMKAELNQLLKERVNVGVSERYLTSGGIDIDELLRQGEGAHGNFLGSVSGIGMED